MSFAVLMMFVYSLHGHCLFPRLSYVFYRSGLLHTGRGGVEWEGGGDGAREAINLFPTPSLFYIYPFAKNIQIYDSYIHTRLNILNFPITILFVLQNQSSIYFPFNSPSANNG